MENTSQLAQKMMDLTKYGNDTKFVVENVQVEFFVPYTRNVWEFRVNGVVTERRYTAKQAALYLTQLLK